MWSRAEVPLSPPGLSRWRCRGWARRHTYLSRREIDRGEVGTKNSIMLTYDKHPREQGTRSTTSDPPLVITPCDTLPLPMYLPHLTTTHSTKPPSNPARQAHKHVQSRALHSPVPQTAPSPSRQPPQRPVSRSSARHQAQTNPEATQSSPVQKTSETASSPPPRRPSDTATCRPN